MLRGQVKKEDVAIAQLVEAAALQQPDAKKNPISPWPKTAHAADSF
jgi:hypothetical protein